MTPEERALERFVKEKQRGNRKGALFDLEDAEEDGQLTHFGQSLSLDPRNPLDDFKEAGIEVSNGESPDVDGERPSKRQKTSDSSEEEVSEAGEGRQTERPKTKKEVMNEIIAKSKLYKYERQQAKEDDDDLRAELDKGLPDVYALLRATPRQAVQAQKPKASNVIMNPDRAALLNGKDRSQADREYDERLRQMVFDQRSKPTERTMTEEEKVEKEAQRLKELEERRLQRMRGEQDSNDEEATGEMQELHSDEDLDESQDNTFGLGSGLGGQLEAQVLGVEDEDEFVIEDDLIANESDVELSESNSREDSEKETIGDDEDDAEFVGGLLSKDDVGRAGLVSSASKDGKSIFDTAGSDLAYTYACPQSHEELLHITTTIRLDHLPIVVQRIRALYHPKLHKDNKTKLGKFSVVLVDHVSFLANQAAGPPFGLLETLIRHIHSLAKTFPEEIGRAFRSHLKSLHEDRPTAPTPGDMILLTAIASIFPTSDHFHQVVTPATLCITRYLSQKIPQSLSDLATGTFQGSLCLQYQRISKRYIPELVNYTLNTLLTLAPVKGNHLTGSFPYHAPVSSLRIEDQAKRTESAGRQLKFSDIISVNQTSNSHNEELKQALINTHLKLVTAMADLWADKSAFCEVFDPIVKVLGHLSSRACSTKLPAMTNVGRSLPCPQFPAPFANLSFPETRHPNPHRPPRPPPQVASRPQTARAPFAPPARDQDGHPEVRGKLRAGPPLRPGPGAGRAQQAEGGAPPRAQRRPARAAQGRQLHGARRAAGEARAGRRVRAQVQAPRGRDPGRGRPGEKRLRAGKKDAKGQEMRSFFGAGTRGGERMLGGGEGIGLRVYILDVHSVFTSTIKPL